MHWDTADVTSSRNNFPPGAHQLANYKGVQQDYRRCRNTLFFLVTDSDRIDGMLQNTRRWLALERLVRNRNRMKELRLSAEHRDRLVNWHKEGTESQGCHHSHLQASVLSGRDGTDNSNLQHGQCYETASRRRTVIPAKACPYPDTGPVSSPRHLWTPAYARVSERRHLHPDAAFARAS